MLFFIPNYFPFLNMSPTPYFSSLLNLYRAHIYCFRLDPALAPIAWAWHCRRCKRVRWLEWERLCLTFQLASILGKLNAFPIYHSIFPVLSRSYKGVFSRLDGEGQLLSLIFPPIVLSEIYNAREGISDIPHSHSQAIIVKFTLI